MGGQAPSVLFGGLTSQLLFQAEDNADDDFSPWQEGTNPTLVSVPNPVFGSSDVFCEPFDVSMGWEVRLEGWWAQAPGLALLGWTLPPSAGVAAGGGLPRHPEDPQGQMMILNGGRDARKDREHFYCLSGWLGLKERRVCPGQ